MSLSINEAAAKIRARRNWSPFPRKRFTAWARMRWIRPRLRRFTNSRDGRGQPADRARRSIEMARTLVAEWPPLAEELARRWWPGPLTLVLPKDRSFPILSPRVCPRSECACRIIRWRWKLIRAAGVPLAAPSANRFTGLSPTTAEHVQRAFGDSVAVLDGGPRGRHRVHGGRDCEWRAETVCGRA